MHDRRRDRPDRHLRHGRAPPRDHRRPPAPRVQRRGARRQAAGRVPRDDHAAAPKTRTSSSASPAGAAQYGHVRLVVEPNERGRGYVVREPRVGQRHPGEFIPRSKRRRGGAAARRARRIPDRRPRGQVVGGSYHEVDSNEMAFKVAGSMAFVEAADQAQPHAARADDAGRGRHARRITSATSSATPCATRKSHWNYARPGVQADRLFVPLADDVRLRDRPAVADTGSRHVHDGVRPLRAVPRRFAKS